jgi:thiamine biosynthesis lipoprotein
VFGAVLLGLTTLRLCGAGPAGDLAEFRGTTMGTTYSVKLAESRLSEADRQALAGVIEQQLATVDRLMSTWNAESELSRFNRLASTGAFPASAKTLEVFQVAREVSELTGGAFDVTVGPLVAAFGFGATDRVPGVPPPELLQALRERVGFRRVVLDVDAGSLSKTHPGTECDLSAIAKGYGVDEVARSLLERGHDDFLVEVGGELRARGQRSPDRAWRVAIERPDSETRSVFAVLELRDHALATSGDYRSYFEQDGLRLSHLIDPRLGRPIAHALASVSVLHEQAVYADALATALGVLGPEEGYALAEREGLAAYFILREPGGGLRGVATPALPPLERPQGSTQARAGG